MAFPEQKLVDCCELITDGDHQPPPKSESGVPFITISDIDAYNTITYEKVAFAPTEYYCSLKDDRKARKGDVLYSVVGTYGKPVFKRSDAPIVFQRHIALLRANDKVLTAFLYYSLLNRDFYCRADAVAIGAAQKTITLNALRNLQIPLPNLETQERIVRMLEPYDALIENNRRQIKLLEEAAQRLYKEWFVDLRFPGHEHTPIVNGMPQGWRMMQLDQIADIECGQSPKSEYYNTLGEGLPFHQGVGSYGARFVKDDTYSSVYSKVAPAGSILFSVRAPVGRLNVTMNEVAIGRGLAAMNHVRNRQSFLFYMLKAHFFKEDLAGNGAIFASISKPELKKMKFRVPGEDLQELFEAEASRLDAKLAVLVKQNDLLTEARDRLLPKLMSGEIEVQALS